MVKINKVDPTPSPITATPVADTAHRVAVTKLSPAMHSTPLRPAHDLRDQHGPRASLAQILEKGTLSSKRTLLDIMVEQVQVRDGGPPAVSTIALDDKVQQSLDNRALWDPHLFSDPTQHDPSKYRYITRALFHAGINNFAVGLETMLGSADGTKPGQLATETMLSASIIDEKHTSSFINSSIAVILDVPPDNIYATSPKDLLLVQTKDTAWYQQSAVAKAESLLGEVGIRSPEEVIENTPTVASHPQPDWNELVLIGRSPSGTTIKPRAIAVIRLVPEEWDLEACRPAREKVEAIAQRYGLPVVVLKTTPKNQR